MTRSKLIELLSERLDIDRTTADKSVRTIFEAIGEALTRGESVELRGFGSFTVRRHDGYRGRNPRSGETVEVSAKKTPYFKVGRPFKATIRGKRALAAARRAAPPRALASGDGGE